MKNLLDCPKCNSDFTYQTLDSETHRFCLDCDTVWIVRPTQKKSKK